MNLPELRRVVLDADHMLRNSGPCTDRSRAWDQSAWEDFTKAATPVAILELLNSYDSLHAAAVRLAQMQVKHCYQGMFDLDGVEFCEVCGNVGEVKVLHKSDCPVGQVMSLEGK